jgi:hypothetical protein
MIRPSLDTEKRFEYLAAVSSGRIRYNPYTYSFDPYQTQSQVRRQEIKKETGFRKWKDNALFLLSKTSGIQKIRDHEEAKLDEHNIQKFYEQGLSLTESTKQIISNLNQDVKKHTPNINVAALQLFGFGFGTVMALGTTGYGLYKGYQGVKALERGRQMEFLLAKRQFRKNALSNIQVRKALLQHLYHPPEMMQYTEEGMLTNMAEKECGICFREMNHPAWTCIDRYHRVLHCRGTDGFLAEEPTPYHYSCLNDWRKSQLESLRNRGARQEALQHADFFSMPCPACREPMVSEELIRSKAGQLAPELVYPKERSFRAYAMDKLVTQPLSKVQSTLSKQVTSLLRPRGYEAVLGEDAGLELAGHPHAE